MASETRAITSSGTHVHWFFHGAIPAAPATISLDARESSHASVRRLRNGEEVRLFDGAGNVATGFIDAEGSTKRAVCVRVERVDAVPTPTMRIHLAAALPAGDRLAMMLDMATQLGMTDFTPLKCERGRLPKRNDAADKWRRITIESCKQSRRAHVPLIEPAATPAEIAAAARSGGLAPVFAHPGGPPMQSVLDGCRESGFVILIGPEGGFTDAEVASLKASGARWGGLAEGILRVETAAVATLAIVAARLRAPDARAR